MNREFTPYDRALKLKELGFDESCFGFYSKIYGLVIGRTTGNSALYENAGECLAPTFSQAFRWFRDELKYEVFLQKQENLISGKTYSFLIENDLEGIYERSLSKSSIDRAELACLDKLIEIVESKNK
jgi:hypothetical protein